MTDARLKLRLIPGPDGRTYLYFPFMSTSDWHIGTEGFRAKRLSRFLRNVAAGNLVLAGDIIGGTEQEDKTHWHMGGPHHRQVIGDVLRMVRNGTANQTRVLPEGTRVVYIPGNHDAKFRGMKIVYEKAKDWSGDFSERVETTRRKLIGGSIFGMRVEDKLIYTDPKGQRVDISHGDEFDSELFKSEKSRKFWYHLGDQALMFSERVEQGLRKKFPKLEEYSISAVFKSAFKWPINFFMGVNKEIEATLDKSDADRQITGHSHMGGFATTPAGKTRMNDGCCTDDVQALVHDEDGNWALLTMTRHGMRVQMERPKFTLGKFHMGRVSYFVAWDDIGMGAQMAERAELFDDIHTDNAQRLERSICRLYPSQDRAGMKNEIRTRESFVERFEVAAAVGHQPTLGEALYYLESRARLPDLSEAFRKLPVPDPRRGGKVIPFPGHTVAETPGQMPRFG